MQKLYSFFVKYSYRQSVALLSLVWLFGIILGVMFAFATKEYADSLIDSAVNCRISFLGLCAVLLLPVIVAFLSRRAARRWPIFVCVFVKAICLGYSILFMLWTYGNASWLLHFLLSFSSTLTLIPLFYLWIRLLDSGSSLSAKHIQWIFIFHISVGLIDYFLISPSVLAL